MSAILGLTYGGSGNTAPVPIGIAGVSSQLVAATALAAQLPSYVQLHAVPTANALKRDVTDGTLQGGVVLTRSDIPLDQLLIPVLAPGSTRTPGFDVVDKPTSLLGQEWAELVAASLSSQLYAGRVHTADVTQERALLTVITQHLGHGNKQVLNFFAPNISVVFLFIGSGLGMRSLFLERTTGTLVRLTAAPIKPISIVLGKLLAIFLSGLASIGVVWGVTTFAFGADWGSPLGVLGMCFGATIAMCGIGVFLTSLARDEQQAFGLVVVVGLGLSLLGGNLLPSGSLPPVLQTLSLATPNGWALVGFGRLSLLGDSAHAIIGPFLVLCAIAVVVGAFAFARVRRMVEA
jgi:ABC-type multidrug transport system permease subunit